MQKIKFEPEPMSSGRVRLQFYFLINMKFIFVYYLFMQNCAERKEISEDISFRLFSRFLFSLSSFSGTSFIYGFVLIFD